MKTLLAPTEQFVFREKTTLLESSGQGDTTLKIVNPQGFEENDHIVVGHHGTDRAELRQISSIDKSERLVTVGEIRIRHHFGEPVQVMRYNQRAFYGAETEDGSYTELTGDGSPVQIHVDDPAGTYFEYSGSEYKWFKATYRNEHTEEETALTDSIPVKAETSTHYTTVNNIRSQAGLINSYEISDSYLDRIRLQAENEVDSVIIGRYKLPLAEVPKLIENITTALAVGSIAYEIFSEEHPLVKRLGEARAMLKAIADGKQALLDSEREELKRKRFGSMASHPSEDEKRYFTIDQKW